MTKSEVIRLENVWKIYKMGAENIYALKGISLSISKQEFVVIMGPSGSGKSTLMHIIGCLDVPTKGEVFLDGKNISQLSENELAMIRGKKIGFVFQTFNLMPSLTALENVMLPMMFQDIDKIEREKRAYKLLEMVGLADRVQHKPSQLSGGQQQRVAIARALANDPDIILADEPTGNLDSKAGEEVMSLLSKLKAKGKTIVVVTHNPELSVYADKLIHIKDGKITEVIER
ncbi:MAG TPA: ABC transporter ATP-binding protein [Candidatus Altiarchaeales archaeon]|nr:ABC transporter ATP-binding protein [Candidatus Altiarchaeales archaeon]